MHTRCVVVSGHWDRERLSLGLMSCAISHAESTQAEDRHGAWLGDLPTTAIVRELHFQTTPPGTVCPSKTEEREGAIHVCGIFNCALCTLILIAVVNLERITQTRYGPSLMTRPVVDHDS